MKIQIAGLSEGLHTFHFREPVAEVNLAEDFSGDVGVDAELERSGKQLYLKADVRATGMFTCDRCTASFSLTVNAKYRMNYLWNSAEADGLDPSEVQVIPNGLPMIDLADDVRQTILLAVPFKLLCNEECKGLCPHCGADLNKESCTCPPETIESRWETLRGFQADPN
jgi:uncharacterized protein